MGAEPARRWPLAGWRALVQEIAWEAVRRGEGEHADLEWLPPLIEARLAHRVDLLDRAGATDEELAAAREELVAWAIERLNDAPPRRQSLNKSAWPARIAARRGRRRAARGRAPAFRRSRRG
jgi:hypothetical protein